MTQILIPEGSESLVTTAFPGWTCLCLSIGSPDCHPYSSLLPLCESLNMGYSDSSYFILLFQDCFSYFKDLLYSTGNYTQYLAIIYKGK